MNYINLLNLTFRVIKLMISKKLFVHRIRLRSDMNASYIYIHNMILEIVIITLSTLISLIWENACSKDPGQIAYVEAENYIAYS